MGDISGAEIALETVKNDEGKRLKLYKCTEDKWTIGWGRNLEDNGISEDEAELMLKNDLKWAEAAAITLVSSWHEHDSVRQSILINMAFNLGGPRLSKFKNMLAAFNAGNYTTAAVEMLDSRWAKQVGARADRLSEMMRSGKWH